MPGSLSPGFINAHGHLELSHLAGRFAPGSGMIPFLKQVTRYRSEDPDQIQQGIAGALSEIRRQGIVGMGDIVNTTDTLALKQNTSLRFHNFVEVFGMAASTWQNGLKRAEPVLQAFKAQGMAASLSPHAPYSVHTQLLQAIAAQSEGLPISIHMQESPEEQEFFASGKGPFCEFYQSLGIDADFPQPGQSPLSYTLNAFRRPLKLLLVHNTCSSARDLSFAMSSGHEIWFALCPGANRYIRGQLPDVSLFQAYPHRVTIGTDSLASNTELSILGEMILLLEADPGLKPERLIQWASANPARFFGWQHELGSLEPGKAPGLLHISPSSDGRPIGAGSKVELLLNHGA